MQDKLKHARVHFMKVHVGSVDEVQMDAQCAVGQNSELQLHLSLGVMW